jgi:lysyl-tRNA synthetase class 2
MKVNGSYIVKHHPKGPDSNEILEIDFTPPFKKIHMISELENKIGEKLPTDFYLPET